MYLTLPMVCLFLQKYKILNYILSNSYIKLLVGSILVCFKSGNIGLGPAKTSQLWVLSTGEPQSSSPAQGSSTSAINPFLDEYLKIGRGHGKKNDSIRCM